MSRKSKAISDALYAQAQESLKAAGRSGEVGRRLQALISAKHHGIKGVAAIYHISRTTLLSWIKRFEEGSSQGLTLKPGRGRKPKLGVEREEAVRAMIKATPHITTDALKIQIQEQYGITLGHTTVYRLMKKLSFSYITPRPRHYKSNKEAQEAFKKKSPGSS
jgi:transposase